MTQFNMSNFGKNLKFNQRDQQKTNQIPEISEKDLFLETISLLDNVWMNSLSLYEKYKVSLVEYEESYYQIIENLILLKYGYWKAELMLWYVFSRFNEDGELISLMYQLDGHEAEEIVIENPTDLWNFILKVEENNKD